MPREEFGRLPPVEIRALLERLNRDEERRAWQEYREACLCAWYATVHRDTTKHPGPYAPSDFLPSDGEAAEPVRTQTPEDMLLLVMAHNAAHGGTVH